MTEEIKNELHRLCEGSEKDKYPYGMIPFSLIAECRGNADEVQTKTLEVLKTVARKSLTASWPNDAEWRTILPDWFLSRCAQEMSDEEIDHCDKWLRKKPRAEQIRIERRKDWPLSAWLYWFEPGNREWFWWSNEVKDTNTLEIMLIIPGWPFPWEALRWLFRAAGAIDVKPVYD